MMGQIVYWHAPLWEILLMAALSLALLIWLLRRALRRPDPGAALAIVDPALNAQPLFFFDRVRGLICLNDAATHVQHSLSVSGEQTQINVLMDVLFETCEEGRVTRREGWPTSESTLVASPIAADEGSVRCVLAFVAVERPLPVHDTLAALPVVVTDQRDWLEIGRAVCVHRIRPVVRVQREGVACEDEALAWQEYQLSHLEETLLRYLLEHPTEAQLAETLFKVVWPDDEVLGYGLRPDQQDRLRRVVYQLRRHIEPDSRNPRFVVTAHGVGYALYPEQELVLLSSKIDPRISANLHE
jgi:DNA-binding winged helix-turn-helix (wHTH) protein